MRERVEGLKDKGIKAWAVRMIAEWSANDITTMQIIEMAFLYEKLLAIREELDEAPISVQSRTGTKPNPLIKQYMDVQKRFFAFAKHLGVDPGDVIPGEGYEVQD